MEKAKKFSSFGKALEWAKTYARESCLPCYFWRVEKVGRFKFAIAIRSKVSGDIVGWAY